MIKTLTALAMMVGLAAAPAAAVTYDAFASFNGSQGAGGFTYGSYDGTTFTAFTGDTGCSALISNVICLGDLPGAFKSTTGAHQSGSVIVPGDALILHPGPNAGQSAALLFTVPISGIYTYTVRGFVADTNPSGVTIFGIVPGIQADTALATLNGNNLTYNQSFTNFLNAGLTIGLAVNYDGVYFNDSTGLNFTLTRDAVPEPATWALMITGFGLVGVGLRRRAGVTAA